MNINVEQIRELVALVGESNVRELTLKANGRSITLRKEIAVPPVTPAPSALTPVAAVPSITPSTPAPAPSPAALTSPLVSVTAPVVGIVHHVTDRNGTRRWNVGDMVESGAVVCIVESMRVPNEVQAPAAGRIASILVEEDQPVEYSQALMEIDTTAAPVDNETSAEEQE